MSEGIAWIGEHSYEAPGLGVPGMLGRISLTAARGVETEEFLVRLGADPEQLLYGDSYSERHALSIRPWSKSATSHW
ncbi:hypothetical protein ACWCPS_18805 [Streptomyces mauvecolor]